MKWPLLGPLVAFTLLLTATTDATDFTTYHHERNALERPEFEQSHVGMSSLTFVFDRTGSMFDDLDQVRRGTEGIFNTVMKQRKRFIYNYVLVMFHDPDVDEPLITTEPHRFHQKLRHVNLSGGQDCPEMTLTGIKKALEASLPGSFVYVFTDARSKDFHLIDTVLNLIQEKQSSVVFVMTGDCGDRDHVGYQVFDRIASASFGQVFHLQKSQVTQILEYVRHSVSQRKVHLLYEVRETGRSNTNEIPVDSHMSELALSLAITPTIDDKLLDLVVIDPHNKEHNMQAFVNENTTVNLNTVKLIRIKDPTPGIWKVKTASKNRNTLRIFGHGDIDFKYGFTSVQNQNQRIELTQPRPFANQNAYLWVNMTGLNAPGIVERISMVDYQGKEIFGSKAIVARHNPALYVVGPFLPPKKNAFFFVRVEGIDDKDYKFIRIAPVATSSMEPSGPKASMLPVTPATLHKSVNLTCNIESSTEYQVHWRHGDQQLTTVPLMFPHSDTAVWPISRVTSSSAGRYYCDVTSTIGNHSAHTDLDTFEPPPEIVSLRNATAVLGGPALMHCQTQTQGSRYTWYRNGLPIPRGHGTYAHNNGSLVIYNTQKVDIGFYTCKVETRGGTANATIYLSIHETPTARITPKDIFAVENTYFQLSCKVTGVPGPRVQWFHQGAFIDGQRSNVYLIDQNNNLRVYAGTNVKGIFECRADNLAGTASDFSNVNIAEKPVVNIPRDEYLLGVGDNVVLECQVLRGQPTPRIHWERNGQMFTTEGSGTSKYVYQKYGNLHIRGASEVDAGQYTCIAENPAGKDVKTTRVNIGIPPKVITTLPKIEANIFKTTTMQCKALGNPTPTIAWHRNGSPITASDSRFNVAPDGTLTITNVQYDDGGVYSCRAMNSYGTQDRSTQLFVVGLEAPVIGTLPPEMQILEGDDIRIDCILVLGIPPPERMWYRDNQPLHDTGKIYTDGDGALVIKNFGPEDVGQYKCVAKNVVSTTEQKSRIVLISRPRIEAASLKGEIGVTPGENLILPCPAVGTPKPKVAWLLNSHIIDVQSKDYKILPDNSLQISNVGKGHTGVFTCKAVNTAGESTFDTKVSVRTPPTISPSQVSFNHVLGDSVLLPCEFEGEPRPEIKWYLNGAIAPGEIDQNDGSLIMDDITLNHRGEYKCIATNDVGSDEISMNLTVHTIPIIDGSGFPNTFTVTMNETAVLPCPARASPPPERTWLYERNRIELSSETKNIAEMAPNGSLLLKNVMTEHEGFYTCHVSNLAGEDEIIYSLKVQNPPRIVSRLADTVDVVLGVDLELPCRALGTPKPAVSWQKDGFEIIPNSHVHIDSSGSLKIPKVTLNDEGQYKCVAKNPAGEDIRTINVVVQEPPQISDTQPDDFTYLQGEEAILRCDVRASPNPTFRWFRGESEVEPTTERHEIRSDGTLVISKAAKDDNLIYRCRAENTAGFVEVPMRLTIIVPPEITDSDIVHLESVKINEPFSLYCPVVSHPLPHISWRMNENPVLEDNTNVIFSDDKRRLRVTQSRVTDAGIYKCIARNPAGESSKTFEVEVLIPPQKNETIYSVKQSALEHQRIEFGCPVSGIPDPGIEWYVNMVPLKPGTSRGGVSVSLNGEKIIIEDALVEHQGTFTCVAENKAGNLPVDIDLTVFAPPQLGKNENLQKVVDQTTTLQCDVKNDGPKSSIKWLFNGKEELPPDVQTSHYSKQLVILQTKVEHSGTFECLVRNTAGESRKRFDLAVWVKPEFSKDEYDSSVTLVAGETYELVCPIKGNPQPQIEWKRDNIPVTDGIKDNGQILQIQHYEHGKNRYTCVATNEAGSIFRDFVIETITQPKLAGGLEDGETVDTQVLQGHSATLECPIASSQSSVEIDWLRNGHLVPGGVNKLKISSEGTRLSLTDIQPDDTATYTCVAKNAAGEATRNFKINVLVPPKVEGSLMENVDVIEGEELDLQCLFVAEPTPEILWTKDSLALPQSVTLLNEQRSLYIEKVAPYDAGAYQCKLSNVAGIAEKIFNVKVISKPVLLNSEETTSKEVTLGDVVTLDCPIPADLPLDVELSWTKDKIPILHDQENRGITTLSDGRQLHIPKAQISDEATYQCIAKNDAGEATKNFQLNVLVRPNILSEHGDYKVIENNSLVLPCEVEGSPPPIIEWTKNDKPAHHLPNVQILSKGQQFKIIAAQAEHIGSYVCTASNKIGKMDINFDVDVIMKPTIAQRVKDIIEVVKGEKAYFDCVVNDPNFDGEITWLKNYDVISGDSEKFTLMKGNRKLIVNGAQLDDEASYSCRVRNDAGTATINYKLEVLVPPEIIMLEKDKNRTVVENGTIGLSCPATGKPEPTITWYKDGSEITPENISKKIKNGQISGNDLRISRIMLVNGGKFTCEAKNKAGSVDQDVNVEVMTPPKIIRDNISSEIEGKLNDHAEIQCFASGRPAPSITWLKRGRPLEASRDVYLSSNHMRLHFTQLDEKHADKYTCIARNPAGEDKRDFTLTLLESPKIDAVNIPREIETNSGRTTTLNCPATGSPEPQVHWIRDGTPLSQDERFTLLNGGRQLQIRDSKPEDSARFMCIAENRVGSAELSLDLKVIAAPQIHGPEIEEVKVLINYPKELRCDVNGSQPISIEWFRSGRSLESDDGTASTNVYLQPTNMGQRLHILSAQKSDNTRFTCVAKNAAGEARKHFDLIVQIPPSINDSLSSPLVQSVIPNSDFSIDCKVDANPPPTITWFKDNHPLIIDASTILTNDNQTLYVRTAQEKHGGSYACQTTNEVGTTSRKYLINLAAPPVFDQGRETQDILVGTPLLTLTCETSNGTGKINKKWLFNGRPASDGNFSQTVTIDQNKVIINKIRFSDAGEYSCIAENEAGEARKVFSINVLEKPRFVDKTNASASIIIGQPFAIDCSVQGTPKPTIKWLKDGKVIDDEACSVQRDDCQFVSDNQRLIIEEAGENDEGVYSCVAENMPGRDEKDIVVSLLRPPKMEDARSLIEVSQGGAQTLSCPIDDRSVQITWFKDDLPLRPSPNIQILNSGRDLYFMNAESSDTSSYSCRARNEAGEDTAYFDVLILVKPEIMGASFRTMDSISNQTVPIYCRTSGIPFPSIEWFFGDKKIEQSANYEIGENGTLLRVKNVQSKDVGRYSCVAKNKVGRAESDVFLEVIEAPQIVDTPQEIKIIEGQDKTIKCNVKGKPIPEISWRKDGEPIEHIGARGNENYIHISRAQLKDAGHYTCIATNRVGEKRQSIHVKVLVPPKIGDGERILKSVEGNNLTLNCPIVSGTGIPAPEIRWSKNGKLLEAMGSQLHLQNLTVSDATKFSCEAKNEAGTASADYVVDVFVKPRIRIQQSDIRVIEGERARMECKVDGNPPPTIQWLRGGRPITDMNNFLLSPRGESLMILKASTNDGGGYSCLAKNIAGDSEGVFSVTVLTAPYLEQTVDQNPKVIAKAGVTLNCPVRGNPTPVVTWKFNGIPISIDGKKYSQPAGTNDLAISEVLSKNSGRYTCNAVNEVRALDTDYALDVIAPPQFQGTGKKIYEILSGETVTMTCPLEASTLLEISWFRGGNPVYLSENIQISPDGQRITVVKAALEDNGKYTCEAENQAGKTEAEVFLKVYVAPTIDDSNLIENPLAVLGKAIYLECPVDGIPQPIITWLKNGKPLDPGGRYSFQQNNITFGISNVESDDVGKYSCVAENKGGRAEENFNLQVLAPPELTTNETQKITRREGDEVTLLCPVRQIYSPDPNEERDIAWTKDGRSLGGTSLSVSPENGNSNGEKTFHISKDGYRLIISNLKLDHAGDYRCLVTNRAGEVQGKFEVETLSKPTIDNSRNSPEAHVIQGRPFTFHCPVNGYPVPKISWLKDHKIVAVEKHSDLRLIDNGQGLEILSTQPIHKGLWTCQAENDAGDSEINVRLDVWTGPKASVRAGKDGVTRPLGTSVTLFCDTTGNPTPIVTWTFEDRVLLHSPNGTQISEGNKRLDIPVLKLEDSGNYTCVAKNEVGIDDSSIVVDILVPSKIDRDGVQLNQRLPSGQTLTLFCDVKGKPSPKVEWFANKTLIRNGQNPNIKIGEDGGYIEISNVTLSDQGIYQCVASNAAGNDTLDYNVDVDQKPSIMNSGTFQVLEGKVAKLVCNSTGEPTPKITWLRNGLRLETNIRYMIDKNILKIVDTRSDTDSGIYLCMAQNEAGSVQQAFTLEVLVTPKITSTSPNETIVAVGEPFSLRCGASGHPLPAITWELNNENIETSLTSEHRIEGDTLYVKELPQKGTSTFRCTVHNSAGLDEVEFIVKVIAPPILNKEGIQTLNVTKDEPTVINCDVQVDLSDSEIEWQKDGIQLSRDGNAKIDGKNLKFEKAMLNDEGTYKCIAINPAGNATQITKLHVGVAPKINEELGRIVVKKGERAELLCEAVGIPPPQITWLKDNHTLDKTPTEESKTTAVFEDIQPEQAGVYTCRATNWAGTVFKDVDLVVLIPPEITNEKANFTANLRDNIILPCNATGIPEPVVSWLKVPDVDIIGKEEKYQILGSSLAIKNISLDDDGFYHCIAKSEAGQTVATRKVTVILPFKDTRDIWTECNEKGEPIDGIFKQARGDLPESDQHLDHWENRPNKIVLNGSDENAVVRCLPYKPNRDARTLEGGEVIEVAPQFIEEPADYKARMGDEIRLRCSAIGPPMPQIFFEKDGKIIESTKKSNGETEIRKTINSTADFGEYLCIAINSVGESRTVAKVAPNEAPQNLPMDDAEHQLTIVNCTKNGTAQSDHVIWKIGNELVDHLDDSTHAMNNGSLVLSYFAMEDDLDRVNCFVDGEPGDAFQLSYITINDVVPVVKIKPVKIYSHPTQNVLIDCWLKRGNPLTTRIRWSKDNVNLAADGDKIRVLPNNSLLISNSLHTDRGNYKCRGWNSRGKSWDGVDLFVEDAPNTVNANIGGRLNDKSLTFGEMLLPANFTPEIKSNDIRMTIDNLAGTQTTVTRSIMAVVSMPLAFLGYDSSAGAKPVKQRPGNFERITNYEFESGEKMKVKQKAKGFTDDSMDLDVEFEGEVPAGGDYDTVEFDPMEEELIEDAPGHVTGNGHSAVRFGPNHKVPFRWRDSINFDENIDNDFIPEGETMKVTSHPEVTPDGEVKIATTVGKLGRCPDGFTKIKGRCRDIDECNLDPEICFTAGGNNNSICVNFEGGYECQSPCAAGFKASPIDGTCVDIDECELNTADCATGQECINTEGSYECQESCAKGYQPNNSGICQDIDECVTQPCKAPMTCKNLLGTFACVCPKGFPIINGTCEGLVVDSEHPVKVLDYSSDAQNCPAGYYFEKGKCEDTDECAFDAPCAYKCTNIPGSYQCECPNGYVVGENGVCVDVDECQFENACTGTELCFNELGSYSCLAKPCPRKFKFNLNTFQCVPTCTNCSSTPINLHLLPVRHGLPGETPLIRLTAHDHDGRVLRKSSFKIKTPTEFFLRPDSSGSATVLNKHMLTSGTRHQIAIHSISVSHDRKIKYKTDFLVFVSVSQYPF